MASAKGRILPAERLGKQKTSWQIITIIFFLALLSIAELRYANERSTWWVRAWSRSRARPGVDYRGADDLLRSRLHLAKSRANRAGPIAGKEDSIKTAMAEPEPSEIFTYRIYSVRS